VIYLVRHGQTAFNRDGRLQGHLDSDLTELGLTQARRAGATLRRLVSEAGDTGGWRLVSSPLGRARATADEIAAALGDVTVEADPRLIEVSFGAWDGRLRSELQAQYPGTFGASGFKFNAPASEPYDQVVARLSAWLADLEPEGARRVIAVSHGVSGRVLRGLYAGLARDDALALEVPQDAVFRLSGGRIERIDC